MAIQRVNPLKLGESLQLIGHRGKSRMARRFRHIRHEDQMEFLDHPSPSAFRDEESKSVAEGNLGQPQQPIMCAPAKYGCQSEIQRNPQLPQSRSVMERSS